MVKEEEKADKAAERARKKEDSDRVKALQLSQKGNRKATKAPASRSVKKQRQSPWVGSGSGSGVDTWGALATTTSHGRTVILPLKFR